MDTDLKSKKEIFEAELNKLIKDFSVKRNHYLSRYIHFSWAIVVVNALISFSLGLSFVEKLETQFKVISLFFSSVLIVLNGAVGFLNYKNMYGQRTRTLVRLLALRREYRLFVKERPEEATFKELYKRFETIMQDDLSQWLENLPKDDNGGS